MTVPRLIAILLTLSALSFAGVSVSSPSNGTSSASPLHSDASAFGSTNQRVNRRSKFVSVTLNGNKSYISKAFWPEGSSVSELDAAFQMDGNSYNTPYSTWPDELNLSAW